MVPIPDLTRLALERCTEVGGPDVLWQARRGTIALTFDDGPDPDGTPAVLDVLSGSGVPATFFLVVERVLQSPELVERILSEGHSVGLHSDRHEPLDGVDPSELRRRLEDARRTLEARVGTQVRDFRPPYGQVSLNLARVIDELGMRMVMWSVDPRDWEPLPEGKLIARLDRSFTEGELVLLHDGSDGFERQGVATAEALQAVLPLIRGRDLEPVSTNEL